MAFSFKANRTIIPVSPIPPIVAKNRSELSVLEALTSPCRAVRASINKTCKLNVPVTG